MEKLSRGDSYAGKGSGMRWTQPEKSLDQWLCNCLANRGAGEKPARNTRQFLDLAFGTAICPQIVW